ncbi:metal ABC transporter permease [Fundicoccus culcitae]|uniref:Metal ABC transporter permease n=1 Tax=Fundicoccus culcitae TaxID=2969821 RepID=A0ABY5P6X4_9LACT|nr:metal ABC transporter permease [Fundicoccus culcitae]UUX34493.1 metal ABC transporter permease [Fundicoccus culcitae]
MIQILFVLIAVSVATSLIGSLLLLRESLMVADAISHTILLGIVLAYIFTRDLSSPWLIFGAAAFGLFTVITIEGLNQTGQIENDASIGLVFPFFFSIAVVIISKYFSDVHLDIDMVLLGQVELSPLKRTEFLGIQIPTALLQGIMISLVNLLFILIFYKPLKIRLFDPIYAQSIGIKVKWLDLIMMSLVSLTAVTSFESVGSKLVIALMAAPAMTARLLTRHFASFIALSVVFALLNSVLGYYLGVNFNTSISAMVAVTSFVVFLIVLLVTKMPKLHKQI